MQKNYDEATKLLNQLLKQDPENDAAFTLRGHAYYLMGNLFDSEESYIAALRINSENIKKAAVT